VRPERHAPTAVPAAFLEEDSNGWLVTFSDLVLQLFAFVLVVSVLGNAAKPSVPDTVVARPRVAPQVPRRATAPDALSLARFDDLPPPAATPPRAEPAPEAHAVTAPVEVPAVEAPAPLPAPMRSLATELESFVKAKGLEESVQVAVNGGGVTLSISDTIGFASGSAELLADAAPVLAEVRALVEARPDLAVEVAGHTDDRPVHAGVFHSNLDLSLARAARVAHELAAGDPALTARIFAAGYGPQRPVASNGDVEGRARNRRVELRLVPGRE
jgi:flagellar motor protein MotB